MVRPLSVPHSSVERLDVGERLTGVLFVRQRIDHVQALGRLADLHEPILAERADDDRIDPALEVAGDVVNRLAVGVHDVGRNLHHVAAELAHADRERHARTQRGLFEEQADVASVERVCRRRAQPQRPLALEPHRQLDRLAKLLVAEVENRQEVLAPTRGLRRAFASMRPWPPLNPPSRRSRRSVNVQNSQPADHTVPCSIARTLGFCTGLFGLF